MIMKIWKKNKNYKVKEEDLKKIESTIEENIKCPYCSDLIRQNKECMEKHGVKNNLRSVTWHNLKCEDCRNRVILISKHKKINHT